MRALTRTLLLATTLVTFNTSNAQSDEIGVALNELNGAYSGAYRFSVNKEKQLVVDFFNGSGHFRTDLVYLDFLDPEKVSYNAEEKAVAIRCGSEEKCIDKEIFKLDVVRHSSRINLKEASASQAEQSMALIRQIISIHLEEEKNKEESCQESSAAMDY